MSRCTGTRMLATAALAALLAAPALAEKNVAENPEPAAPRTAASVAVEGTTTLLFHSTDVPKTLLDNDPTGVTSILEAHGGEILDIELIIDDLPHTCVPDLHIDLTSPSGTTVTLIRSFPEGGIFIGLGCPDDFSGTVLDDQAATNLRDGIAPFTGSYNIEHASVVTNPLSQFVGESAEGTWTLFVYDNADGDIGTLNAWSLQIRQSQSLLEIPTLSSWGLALLALALVATAIVLVRRRHATAP